MKSTKGSLLTFLIRVILALALCGWLLVNRGLLHFTTSTENHEEGHLSADEQTKHLKKLLADTTNLLVDVMKSNITISADVRRDINRLNKERKVVEADMIRLQLNAVKDEKKLLEYAMKEKKSEESLNQCTQSLSTMKKNHDKPGSSSSSSSAGSNMIDHN